MSASYTLHQPYPSLLLPGVTFHKEVLTYWVLSHAELSGEPWLRRILFMFSGIYLFINSFFMLHANLFIYFFILEWDKSFWFAHSPLLSTASFSLVVFLAVVSVPQFSHFSLGNAYKFLPCVSLPYLVSSLSLCLILTLHSEIHSHVGFSHLWFSFWLS